MEFEINNIQKSWTQHLLPSKTIKFQSIIAVYNDSRRVGLSKINTHYNTSNNGHSNRIYVCSCSLNGRPN